jgi:hypothetical protein
MRSYREHTLLKSQWNNVYEAIEIEDFDPAEFARTTIYGDVFHGSVPQLLHESTGSDFVFDFVEQTGLHAPNWSPGEQQPRDVSQYASDWPDTVMLVRRWLVNVERERSTPDLWAMLGREPLGASDRAVRPSRPRRFSRPFARTAR